MKKLFLIVILSSLGLGEAAALGTHGVQPDQQTQQPQPAQRDTTSIHIDEVVVAAKGRNRAKRYFRRYVRNIPPYGWYVGFTGSYKIEVESLQGWNSQGTYLRNHIPGDDANRKQIELFRMQPAVAADSINSWQIRRYILLAGSIAERAASLGYEPDVEMSYRGREGDLNLFLIAASGSTERRGFRTRLLVSDASGIIVRSESVSNSPNGVWNVEAHYATFDDFIYPMKVTARFEQRDPGSGEAQTVSVEMTDIVPHRFERKTESGEYWDGNRNDPDKVLKPKVRTRILQL